MSSLALVTGEGIRDSTRLVYHTIDSLQSVSIMERREASGQGEGAVAGAREVGLPAVRCSHAPEVPDDPSL